MSQQAGHIINYRSDTKNKNAVQSTDGKGHAYTYKPTGKTTRELRRTIFDRFLKMRDNDIRKQAEKDWDLGRKMVRMWSPEHNEDDDVEWGADIVLPDGFAAIQTYLQETIDARFRPIVKAVEGSDETMAWYNDAIFQHAMDTTEFDAEVMKARAGAAALGLYFTREEYRYETRMVQDPTSYDPKTGTIKYTKKEIIDWDDVYTRALRPDNCYWDETAEDPKYMNDWIYREVLDIDTFKELYGDKPGFKDVDKVVPAGSLDTRVGYFQMAGDLEKNDVEVLHYENRLTDTYGVLANNVIIREGPLPSKHKELSCDIWTFYPVEGQIPGLGIPQIIYSLVEERRTNRNQQLDRNTLANDKMFLANDLFDISDDDLTPRPHGVVKVNTNGLPINQAIMPLEYGDTPMSAIKMDDTLRADQIQAHGLQASTELQPGATATQAAIIKESTQRRINLVNTLSAWNTLIRLGKKKWSNINFFYPAARVERVLQDNKWRDVKKYRNISTGSYKFSVYGDPDKGQPLQLQAIEVPTKANMTLDPTFARFMGDDKDVVIDAQADPVISQPIMAQSVSEIFDKFANNPMYARYLNQQKSMKRVLLAYKENPADWLANEGMSDEDQRILAEKENMMFIDMVRTKEIFMLPGTPGANTAHTEVHLQFTRTPLFKDLPQAVQQAISNHILEENESNPSTANVRDILGGGGPDAAAGGMPAPGGGPDQGGGGNAVLPGQPGGVPAGSDVPVEGAPVTGGDVTQGNGPMPAPVA